MLYNGYQIYLYAIKKKHNSNQKENIVPVLKLFVGYNHKK